MAERGLWQEALDLATRARMLMESLNDRRSVARLHNAYAYICLSAEPPRLKEAEEHLDLAEAILREVGSPGDMAHTLSERARIALLDHRPHDAVSLADQAITQAGSDDLERAKCLLARARGLHQ